MQGNRLLHRTDTKYMSKATALWTLIGLTFFPMFLLHQICGRATFTGEYHSIYVCWEEMGRPDINSIHMSRFELSGERSKFLMFGGLTFIMRLVYTILPLSDDAELVKKHKAIERLSNMIIQYLLIWPLQTCCSIRVKHDKGNFKPEYILPQFLLQWITSNPQLDLDGIQYFSNKFTENVLFNTGQYINYAIPIKSDATEGHCRILKEKVKLTEPISWQILELIIDKQLTSYDDKEKINKDSQDIVLQVFIDLRPGLQPLYASTKFGIAEAKLSKMVADFLR